MTDRSLRPSGSGGDAPEPSLTPEAAAFFAGQPFRPDRFQVEAVAAVEAGRSVVVTAPTGAGKTLVAEAAVHLALQESRRAFYTTPIKALSNQKFSDFRAAYGPGDVGLLTGDNVINGSAPLVVMTTEVLRNMIYSDTGALENLGVVVLDEVHFLQDRYRGSVWEEIIIHLPARIPLVNLSATVANAREFTDWIESRRGPTSLVVEKHRPVPLASMYLLKDRHREDRVAPFPLLDSAGKRAHPSLTNLLRRGRGRRRRFVSPRRLDVAETLLDDGVLPAIYFRFSRAGCVQAASTVGGAGLRRTTADERREIRARIDAATEHVNAADLDVLGFASWAANVQQGVAAHHAGMVPAFKEAVEDLFAAGLVKLAFATETLALGINMPARAVVLERLSRFTGETHEPLQSGDFTQLTGRAGRRGIDTAGSAIVLHDSRVPLDQVAAIASQGSHPLRSSFQPSYNMAVNLVANYDRTTAEELLEASFEQFRREHRRSELELRIAEREGDLEAFRDRAECDRGDIWAYLEEHQGTAADHQGALRDFAQQTRAGDVVQMSENEHDIWALLARGWGGSPRLLVMAQSGEIKRMAPEDLSAAAAIVGFVDLPEPVRTRDRSYQRAVLRLLRRWKADPSYEPIRVGHATGDDAVGACPDLAAHLGWVRRIQRLESELRRLDRRQADSERGLIAHFRDILHLLDDWDYVDGWTLTSAGERLRFVYNELDLLLAEATRLGILEGLGPADVAAVVSMFTYQPRSNDTEGGWPSGPTAEASERIIDLWQRLARAERGRSIPETRRPEAGFAAYAHGWATGHELDDLFEDEFAAGDFVRNCRQLLDLLRQLRDGFPELREVAAEAIRSLDRGIVAAGGRL